MPERAHTLAFTLAIVCVLAPCTGSCGLVAAPTAGRIASSMDSLPPTSHAEIDKGRGGVGWNASLQLRGGQAKSIVPTDLGIGDQGQVESLVHSQEQNFFTFEGLIGAGKSTLLAKLEERGIMCIAEPLKAWQDSGIFGAFYGDMKRWAYTFQTSAFVSRVKAVEDALRDHPNTRDFIGERSWFADAYVFERLLHKDGHISDLEHAAYQQWWTWLHHKAPATRGIIYLRARPETCLSRIKKRRRSEESGIPLDYLEGLYAQHERWLIGKETPYGKEERKVLILDANPDFETDPQRVEGMIDRILEFMRECTQSNIHASNGGGIKSSPPGTPQQPPERTLSGTALPLGAIYWDGPKPPPAPKAYSAAPELAPC